MYLYIENNVFINLREIEFLVDYDDFILNKNNKKIMENGKRKILNLCYEERETKV